MKLKREGVTDTALDDVRTYVKERSQWLADQVAQFVARGHPLEEALEEALDRLDTAPELRSKHSFECSLETEFKCVCFCRARD